MRSLLLLLSTLSATVHAAEPAPGRAFDRLQALVGNWAAPLPSGKEIRLNYRLVSAGTVLVETYTPPSGKETLTVYHLDGPRLLATHYCAQGNQPRLRLTSDPAAPKLVFELVDVTNLETPQSSHLSKLEVGLTDSDHFTKAETYRQNAADETETLTYARVKPGPRK